MFRVADESVIGHNNEPLPLTHHARATVGIYSWARLFILEQATQSIHALLRKHGKGIAKVWLARREIPSDPDARTYVVGIRVSLLTRLLRRERKVMKALIKAEWPMHAFICNTRVSKVIGAKFRAVADAEVTLAS